MPSHKREEIFIVHHYAEPVTYTASGFVEKNLDAVSDELIEVLKKSEVSKRDCLKMK